MRQTGEGGGRVRPVFLSCDCMEDSEKEQDLCEKPTQCLLKGASGGLLYSITCSGSCLGYATPKGKNDLKDFIYLNYYLYQAKAGPS
ncbi:hypothetical protein XELAEV_18025346mg [Xenopus laevis]|uniref:Uncharacterized protein n=1 Tax=Xenopus laevis TaxID=8355 RepID=A0A974D1W1_XENLA|nr:hypothetical protein XELAEV_18025346mg [Xenopus laevis]